MTQLVVGVRLTATNAELLGPTRQSTAAMAELRAEGAAGAAAARDVGRAAEEAGAGLSSMAAAEAQVSAASGAASTASAELAASLAAVAQQRQAAASAQDAQVSGIRDETAAQASLRQAVDQSGQSLQRAGGHASNYSMAQVVLQSAIRKTTDQFAAGAPWPTIFAEHVGTLAEVLQLYAQQANIAARSSTAVAEAQDIAGAAAAEAGAATAGMGGAMAAAAEIISGPLGIGLTALVSVLALLVPKLLDSEDASKKAAKGLDEFEKKQADIGNFIDSTTGKLKEQNQTLIRNAELTRQKAIGDNNKTVVDLRNQAFAAARSKQGDSTPVYTAGGVTQPLFDKDLKAVIDAAGPSVTKLDAGLQALASRRKDLKDLSTTVSNLAGQAVRTGEDTTRLRGELSELSVVTQGGTVQTSAMIERQVALGTATTAVAKATAQLNDVKARGASIDKMAPGSAKNAALEQYRVDLTNATQAVDNAKQAEKDAAQAKRDARKEQAEENKEAREAAKTNRELEATLDGIVKKFDPATEAARAYAKQLADIEKLRTGGKISDATAVLYDYDAKTNYDATLAKISKEASKPFLDATKPFEEEMSRAVKGVGEGLEDASTRAGAAFERRGLQAVEAIAGLLGGKLGRIAQSVVSLLSATSGSASGYGAYGVGTIGTARGGGIAGLIGALGSSPTDPYGGRSAAEVREAGGINPTAGNFGQDLAGGLEEVFAPLKTGLDHLTRGLTGIFGDQGSFTRVLGKGLGYGAIGGSVASLIGGSSLGGSVGGALGGLAGDALKGAATQVFGKTLGSLAGPLGSIAGGLLGSVLGGLFAKPPPTGGATISNTTGDATLSGNNQKLQQVANGLAGQVQDGLSQIAQQLGGVVGSFNAITIGEYKDKYRVNTQGTKLGGSSAPVPGLKDFGDDSAGAVGYAIQQAIAEGAVTGLSAAVQKALKSSSDINKALAEALKVQDVELLIGGIGAQLKKTFTDFDAQAADRIRIAKQYGLDVVAVEKANADAREKLITDTLKNSVGSLQDLLTDMKSGSLAEGDAGTKRQALLDQITEVKKQADAGVDGAAQQLSTLYQQLLTTDRDSYGTAGDNYTSDRDLVSKGAEEVIKAENDRIQAAQQASQQTNDNLTTANQLSNENNDQNAQMISKLDAIYGALTGGGSGSSFNPAVVQR